MVDRTDMARELLAGGMRVRLVTFAGRTFDVAGAIGWTLDRAIARDGGTRHVTVLGVTA